jgi:hypothetical protein
VSIHTVLATTALSNCRHITALNIVTFAIERSLLSGAFPFSCIPSHFHHENTADSVQIPRIGGVRGGVAGDWQHLFCNCYLKLTKFIADDFVEA